MFDNGSFLRRRRRFKKSNHQQQQQQQQQPSDLSVKAITNQGISNTHRPQEDSSDNQSNISSEYLHTAHHHHHAENRDSDKRKDQLNHYSSSSCNSSPTTSATEKEQLKSVSSIVKTHVGLVQPQHGSPNSHSTSFVCKRKLIDHRDLSPGEPVNKLQVYASSEDQYGQASCFCQPFNSSG